MSDPTRDALILVDVQADFMEGGALPVAGGRAIVEHINRFLRLSPLAHKGVVAATQDWHPKGHESFASTWAVPAFSQATLNGESCVRWPDHCVQGTPGARLHPALDTDRIDLILRKGTNPRADSYSAFRENVGPDGLRADTGLAEWLRARGIDRVFVCGLAFDYCVKWTALDAVAAGFEVAVLTDLTAAVNPAAGEAVASELREAGVALLPSVMVR